MVSSAVAAIAAIVNSVLLTAKEIDEIIIERIERITVLNWYFIFIILQISLWRITAINKYATIVEMDAAYSPTKWISDKLITKLAIAEKTDNEVEWYTKVTEKALNWLSA